MQTLNAAERITKAKIQALSKFPYWAYLVMFLKAEETDKIATAAVTKNANRVYYNPEFVLGLSDDEIVGLLAHEVAHVAMDHPGRVEKRNHTVFNVATDLWINATLLKDGVSLPACGLNPTGDKFTIWDVTVTKISTRSAEEIYSLLIDAAPGDSGGGGEGFDSHEMWGEDGGTPYDQAEWASRVARAEQAAKMQGSSPNGAERILQQLTGRRIDWRSLLQSEIVSLVPHDYTFARPSRRSIQAGMYLPSVRKEALDIVWAEDTSGSMSAKDIAEGRALMVDVLRAFQNVTIHVLSADAGVHDAYVLTEQTMQQFLDAPALGGGGTDFRPAFEYANEKLTGRKLMVYYTDGYGTFPERPTFNTIWLLQPKHISAERVPFGRVIPLEKYPLPERA